MEKSHENERELLISKFKVSMNNLPNLNQSNHGNFKRYLERFNAELKEINLNNTTYKILTLALEKLYSKIYQNKKKLEY